MTIGVLIGPVGAGSVMGSGPEFREGALLEVWQRMLEAVIGPAKGISCL